MSRLTLTRWGLATLLFLGLGWVDVRYGHAQALALLLAFLLLVYFFGGRSSRSGPSA